MSPASLLLLCCTLAAPPRVAGGVAQMPGGPPTRGGLLETVLLKRVDLVVADIRLYDLVERLRSEYHVPLSFIDPLDAGIKHPTVTLRRVDASMADILEDVAARTGYVFDVIEGRPVLYPRREKYTRWVTGVDIKSKPRMQAGWAYIEVLNSRIPGFTELVATPIRGYPAAPVYSEPVTLAADARVIDHLVQLLGHDPAVAFSIEPNRFGMQALFFVSVR